MAQAIAQREGDRLLVQIARRLEAAFAGGPSDGIARDIEALRALTEI